MIIFYKYLAGLDCFSIGCLSPLKTAAINLNKMDMSVRIHPVNARGPFIREVKSNKDDTLVYDGYFYYKDSDLPLQRVMNVYSEETVDDKGDSYRSLINSLHIEIYERISGEDTSFYGDEKTEDVSGNTVDDDDDDSDAGICLFPTEITTLKYRVLKSNMTQLERTAVFAAINDLEKTREKKKLDRMVSDDV